MQGQGEFWHGLEAAQQDFDLEQDETPNFRDTWVLTPGMPFVVVWDTLQLAFLLFICLTEPFRVGFHVVVAPGE